MNHASIEGLQFHYWFDDKNDCLVITTTATADGGMSLSWMLAWKPEDGFRVERLREDPLYGIGTRHEAPLTDFPFAATVTAIKQNGHDFEGDALRRILDLLHQAVTAASTLKGNP